MDAKKVYEVCGIYRKLFEDKGIGKQDYPHDKLLESTKDGLEHCHGMLDRMEKFAEDKVGKLMRWLGFIQGFLWAKRIFTLTDLQNHNRPQPNPYQLKFDFD